MLNLIIAAVVFSQVCPTVKSVRTKDFLYKSELSNGIGGPDVRAGGPTLVCGKVCPVGFPANVYYSDGKLALKLGYYGTYNGNGKPRAYCGVQGVPRCSNSKIASNAIKNKRNGYLYLEVKPKLCYKVKPLGRTGSI